MNPYIKCWGSEERVVSEFGHEFSLEHYLCDLDRVREGLMRQDFCGRKWMGVIRPKRLNSDLLAACLVQGKDL